MRTRGQRLRLNREQVTSVSDPMMASQHGSVGSGIHPLATSLLDLQRLAGNRAVAAEIGSWRNGRVVTPLTVNRPATISSWWGSG
jgi:hypothetical protein